MLTYIFESKEITLGNRIEVVIEKRSESSWRCRVKLFHDFHGVFSDERWYHSNRKKSVNFCCQKARGFLNLDLKHNRKFGRGFFTPSVNKEFKEYLKLLEFLLIRGDI